MKKQLNKWIIETIKTLPLSLLNVIIFIYLLAPLMVVLATSFSKAAYPIFPPKALSLRWYSNFFQNEQFIDSLVLSCYVALCTTIVALIIGIPASLALVLK
jgi:putative spermidine/putrescine transport system permease protein